MAEDAIIPGRDVDYTMDALDRLTRAQEGTWSGSAITSETTDEAWTLDHLGNWDAHTLDFNADNVYTGTDELDETRTHNAVNELEARDLDDDGTDDETLAYNATGEMTDDGADWKYVYDAFGRLRELKDQAGTLVAEYRYNGLGFQIAEHADTDSDSDVDLNDLWYYNAFDERWRKLATFRSSDTDPKEEFVPHQAGLDGAGGSSYINDMVLRDKDANTAWTAASDGTLEERIFYLNNWRGDVVGLVTGTGYQAEMDRYSSYGTPFGYPGGDCNEDGAADSADRGVILGWIAASTYDVRGDLDLDGDVDSTDSAVFASSYSGTTAGRGVLSAGGNEIGYAGMLWFDSGRYLARNRWHDPELGRWGRRDSSYIDSLNLYEYASSDPAFLVDPSGRYSDFPLLGEDEPIPPYKDESGVFGHPGVTGIGFVGRGTLVSFSVTPIVWEGRDCFKVHKRREGKVFWFSKVANPLYAPCVKRVKEAKAELQKLKAEEAELRQAVDDADDKFGENWGAMVKYSGILEALTKLQMQMNDLKSRVNENCGEANIYKRQTGQGFSEQNWIQCWEDSYWKETEAELGKSLRIALPMTESLVDQVGL